MYNILIVDDEKIERNGIKLLLKRMGINLGIIEAGNGKEAYDYLMSDDNKGEGHIDILLTDVKMPFMDGITLIKKLNENNIKLNIFSFYPLQTFLNYGIIILILQQRRCITEQKLCYITSFFV